jgi:hypothetical protein
MIRLKFLKPSILLAAATFILIPSQLVSAAASRPTGITISPAYQQINILSSETTQPVIFKVTNNEYYPQTLQLKTSDFSAFNNTGGLFFVGTNPTELQKSYGLAKWLNLPEETVTIAPRQTSNVTVVVQNRDDLAPGGHYGALLFYVAGVNSSLKTNRVGVYPVATALMFVTKINGATYRLSLNQVNYSSDFFKLPTTVSLRFYDAGNTQLTPRGYITITDSKGNLISKGIINEGSLLLLPQNYRYYSVPLQPIAITKRVGVYKLTVYYTFDGYTSHYRVFQASLFLGTPELLLEAIGLLIIVLAVVFYSVRYYKRLKPKSQPPNATTKDTTVKQKPVKKPTKKIKIEIK